MSTIYQTYIDTATKRLENQFAEQLSKNENDAFIVFSVALILDKPMESVIDNILVVGKEDGGIDAAYLENNTGNYILHLFQGKSNTKMKANDIEKFQDNVEEIFIKGNRKKAHSANLMHHLERIGYFGHLNKYIEKKLYFVFKGDIANSDNQNTIKQVNSSTIDYIGGKELYEMVGRNIRQLTRKEIKVTFQPEGSNFIPIPGEQALISFSLSDVRSAMFRLPVLTICELIDTEKQLNGAIGNLFSNNIRGFLGKNNVTNSRIADTLQSPNEKYYFPFLNNGITIICKKMKIPALMQDGKYLIDVTNPVIVNGLQTTNVLYEHYLKHPNSLNGVFVVVRVYETDDETLIDLITDATNTQTAIDFRDKLSNKPFMLQIKAFFELHNVAFITKRGEAFRNFYQETVFETSIENDAALRNWYRYFIEENGILEPERSVMEEFFEANRNTLHPLHLFLYTCIDNFASQIFWVNRLIRICENELKRQEIPLFRKVSLQRQLIKYALQEKIQTKTALTSFLQNTLETLAPEIEKQAKLHANTDLQFNYKYNDAIDKHIADFSLFDDLKPIPTTEELMQLFINPD